jgi:hypothetical protein
MNISMTSWSEEQKSLLARSPSSSTKASLMEMSMGKRKKEKRRLRGLETLVEREKKKGSFPRLRVSLYSYSLVVLQPANDD